MSPDQVTDRRVKSRSRPDTRSGCAAPAAGTRRHSTPARPSPRFHVPHHAVFRHRVHRLHPQHLQCFARLQPRRLAPPIRPHQLQTLLSPLVLASTKNSSMRMSRSPSRSNRPPGSRTRHRRRLPGRACEPRGRRKGPRHWHAAGLRGAAPGPEAPRTRSRRTQEGPNRSSLSPSPVAARHLPPPQELVPLLWTARQCARERPDAGAQPAVALLVAHTHLANTLHRLALLVHARQPLGASRRETE